MSSSHQASVRGGSLLSHTLQVARARRGTSCTSLYRPLRRNLNPRVVEARLAASPTLNLLVVTARPGVGRDIGYRTISRPLLNALRQANLPVQVDILRPGSYEALANHIRLHLSAASRRYSGTRTSRTRTGTGSSLARPCDART